MSTNGLVDLVADTPIVDLSRTNTGLYRQRGTLGPYGPFSDIPSVKFNQDDNGKSLILKLKPSIIVPVEEVNSVLESLENGSYKDGKYEVYDAKKYESQNNSEEEVEPEPARGLGEAIKAFYQEYGLWSLIKYIATGKVDESILAEEGPRYEVVDMAADVELIRNNGLRGFDIKGDDTDGYYIHPII